MAVTIIAVLTFSVSAFAGTYGGGTGEPNAPYLIYDANHMQEIGANFDDWDKNFKLMAEIDLSNYDGRDGRPLFNIIGNFHDGSFTGAFDGNDHIISHFTFILSGLHRAIALFGNTKNEATIKNLHIRSAYIYVPGGNRIAAIHGEGYARIINCSVTGTVEGDVYVGGISGQNHLQIEDCSSSCSITGGVAGGIVGQNNGTIQNSYTIGTISGNDNIGGLVGKNYGLLINSHSEASVISTSTSGWGAGGLAGENGNAGVIDNSFASGNVNGHNGVGGLIGMGGGAINNVYATGNVSGDSYVGGLIGWNFASIINSYAVGEVSGTIADIGGLVGKDNSGTYQACFWNTTIDPSLTGLGNITDPPDVMGRTTTEMQIESTFTTAGWDFATPVWTIDEGNDYPRLWRELAIDPPVLNTEPEMTFGTSNTISWEPVPDVQEYYAECADDPDFTNIVASSGWITETSFEFTSLELGQTYWYSVKAGTATGTESEWSNVELSQQVTLGDAVSTTLDEVSLKNANMKNALGNKITAVLEMINQGRYEAALQKLQEDILAKTDGCAETGEPDKNDWILTCDEQDEIYQLITEAIGYLESLM